MNSQVELIVLGKSGSTAVGIVDMHGDEPIQLNISCADIKDIKSRKSTYSQSFVVPGTQNNNTLFNFIFEIDIDSQFDPRKKTPCQLLVDTIPVVKNGNLQLTGIIVDDQKNISYEITIFDETEDLVDAIGSLELTDIDFSDLDHVWNIASIFSSWVGSNQKYFYPLIDYGNVWSITSLNSGNGVDVSQMYPATQAKTIFDRILDNAGYTYSSTFLNTDYFKNLYIPYNGNDKLTLDPTTLFNLGFNALSLYNITDTFVIPPGPLCGCPSCPPCGGGGPFIHNYNSGELLLPLGNDSTGGGFDNGGNYNSGLWEYVNPIISNQEFNIQLIYEFTGTAGLINISNTYVYLDVFRSSYSSSIPFASSLINPSVAFNTIYLANYTTPQLNGPAGSSLQPAQIGETFWVAVRWGTQGLQYYNQSSKTVIFNALSGGIVASTGQQAYTQFWNTPQTTLLPGDVFVYNNAIPKKIKQIDFINSIITMHNLYVISDPDNAKNVFIEPRDQYYSTGATKDWSGKLDLNSKVHEQLLSEQQNNRIVFTYKEDKDYYNDSYKTSVNRIFGDEYVNMNNDFTKDDKTISVLFSPTPNASVGQSPAKTGLLPNVSVNDFVIPVIEKVTSSNGQNTVDRTDFNIRILQKNQDNLLPLSNGETWILDGNVLTDYPYLGMLNHPYSGDTDIAFGAVEYENYTIPYITSNNLVNRFYINYLNQIIDKDSKLITAQFYLTPADIQDFKYNDIIFIDSLASDGLGSYFLVNNIKYTPTSNATSEVELIKFNTNKLIPTDSANIPIRHQRKSSGNHLIIGGASTESDNAIAMGQDVYVGSSTMSSLAIGSNLRMDGGTSNILMGSGSTIGVGSLGAIIIGNGNIIGDSSRNSFSFGNNNIIGTGTTSPFIYGSNNIINSGLTNVAIFGEYSQVLTIPEVITSATTAFTSVINTFLFGDSITANTNSVVFGNNVYVSSAATNSFILGNNITATTSGTVYVENIQFSSGGTINLIPVQEFIDCLVWSASTGTSSAVLTGSTSIASGNYSVAEGNNTIASGTTSHAEGTSCHAGGSGSHSEGIGTIALGSGSHSEGLETQAIGEASHSEGTGTKALSSNSHAGGILSIATGTTSFVHGSGSTASGNTTIVLGDNLTGTTNNTVYVPNLNINIVGPAISIEQLGIDANGFVVSGITPYHTLITSATTLNLTDQYSRYVYNGSSATTWTFYSLSTLVNREITIHNRDSGTILINSNTGGNDFSDLGIPTSFKIINAGETYSFFNDSQYIIIY